MLVLQVYIRFINPALVTILLSPLIVALAEKSKPHSNIFAIACAVRSDIARRKYFNQIFQTNLMPITSHMLHKRLIHNE